MEIWKDIKDYEGLYQVSNMGRVKSLLYNREKILKPTPDGKGYLQVKLSNKKSRKVHRLVIENFRGKSDLTVNHINKNIKDNRLENLEYMTNSDNIRYSQAIPIIQKSMSGEFIKKWDAINDAVRETKITHICDCLKGKRKKAGGFKWEYAIQIR